MIIEKWWINHEFSSVAALIFENVTIQRWTREDAPVKCLLVTLLLQVKTTGVQWLSLTCRVKHWGEDQQASYPHLDFHPKPVSPKKRFDLQAGFCHQSRSETTQAKLCLPLSCLSGTGSGGELLCQVTQRHTVSTYTHLSPTHENTLFEHAHGKINEVSHVCSFVFVCFCCVVFQQGCNRRWILQISICTWLWGRKVGRVWFRFFRLVFSF